MMMHQLNQKSNILCPSCQDLIERVKIETKFHYNIFLCNKFYIDKISIVNSLPKLLLIRLRI
jgi:hypothetical protein